MKISRLSFPAALFSFALFSFALFSFALFSFAMVSSAQIPKPMPLAHGNVPGEPHHRLKIENEYVRAYYAEVPAHESAQLHQHDHDYLYVSLGNADVINTSPGKPEVHLKLRDGEIKFARGGFAHATRNLRGEPFRVVLIELLKPQLEAHECLYIGSGHGAGGCEGPATPRNEEHFESAECRLDLAWVVPSNAERMRFNSKLAFLAVGLSGAEVRVEAKGKPPKTLRAGEMEWFDYGSDVEFSSDGQKAAQVSSDKEKVARFLVLKFKDSEPHANP